MYTPRAMGGVSGRIPEFLENLKVEFESLAHDANMYKMQRDDYERKLTAQLNELNNIQQTLFELERKHTTIKTQYEEEIIRLRRQLELQNSSGGNPPTFSQGTPSVPPIGASPIVTPAQPATPSQHNRPQAQEKPSPRPQPPATPPTVSNPRGPSRPSKDDKHDEDSGKKSSGRGSQPYSDSSDKKGERNESVDANGADWIVGYNPVVQTNLNIDLSHNLEHQSVVCCVKFSHDGKHLATGCNKSAQIYDAETGEKVHTFTDESGKEGDLYIRSVCFSPDNRFLAAGAEDKTVKIWDIEQKRMRSTFIGHELDIYSLDFSYDGKSIVSGSGDKKAKIWDVEKGECLFTLGNEEVGPKDGVTSVAFSPDGKLVAAGSLDKIVRLWDARTGYFLERYEGHLDSVYSVAFSPEPDSKSLASGSLDKTLKLWDLAGSRSRSRCRSTFSGHKDYVLSVAFSHDGNWLISGSKDRTVQFWDPRSAVTHMMLQGHKNSVISVAVSPTGGQFATGSGDFRARVWKYD